MRYCSWNQQAPQIAAHSSSRIPCQFHSRSGAIAAWGSSLPTVPERILSRFQYAPFSKLTPHSSWLLATSDQLHWSVLRAPISILLVAYPQRSSWAISKTQAYRSIVLSDFQGYFLNCFVTVSSNFLIVRFIIPQLHFYFWFNWELFLDQARYQEWVCLHPLACSGQRIVEEQTYSTKREIIATDHYFGLLFD